MSTNKEVTLFWKSKSKKALPKPKSIPIFQQHIWTNIMDVVSLTSWTY